ncbi:MAG: hypothetical protein RR481_03605, partial [Longicatena sp.]
VNHIQGKNAIHFGLLYGKFIVNGLPYCGIREEVKIMEEIKVTPVEEFDMEIQKCDADNCNYDCKPYSGKKCDSFWTTLW